LLTAPSGHIRPKRFVFAQTKTCLGLHPFM
jgi:hypothetical protein